MRHDESRTQQECVKWFRLQYPQLARLLFAVPNGGARNKVTASVLKSEGVTAGVADLILFAPRGGFHALCIEMKTETGRQSSEQKEWQREVEGQGYKYVLCRTFEDFFEMVVNYLESSKLKGE